MNIPLPARAVLKPSVVSMAAMFASLGAWLFPSFGVLRKGFDTPSRPDLNAFIVLACWYMLIFVSFVVGEKLGGWLPFRRTGRTETLLDLKSNVIYYGFTLISSIGIAATVIRVFQLLSVQQAIVFITLGQANELIDALYKDYSVGLVSLRYIVLYSASLALYRIIRLKSFAPINIFNVLMLVLSALLSSRLIFVATLLTTVLLLGFGKSSIRINVPKLITVASLLFLVLAVLNYSRNKSYYEGNKLSFGLAGLSEIVTYLGAPFQAAFGTAGITDQLVAGGDQTYRRYVDEEIVLNTNSAFVHLHEQVGYFSWPYIALTCLFMGFAFEALASLGKTIFLLPCGAILYGSAELWRLDLFQQGTFIVWIIIGIGLPAFLIAGKCLLAFIGGVRGMAVPDDRIPPPSAR